MSVRDAPQGASIPSLACGGRARHAGESEGAL